MEGEVKFMIKIFYHRDEDGMEYPNLNLSEEDVSMRNLGRFAVRAAEYLNECYKERYQTRKCQDLMYKKYYIKMYN